jgi:hypothetical protein
VQRTSYGGLRSGATVCTQTGTNKNLPVRQSGRWLLAESIRRESGIRAECVLQLRAVRRDRDTHDVPCLLRRDTDTVTHRDGDIAVVDHQPGPLKSGDERVIGPVRGRRRRAEKSADGKRSDGQRRRHDGPIYCSVPTRS